MRVISGTAKGRTLKSPGAATRPITDRVKENLFNVLGARVEDANVLDLFAGAGSVGIEALSRGARRCTFVEKDNAALRAIKENLELTRLNDRARVVRDDVFRFIRHWTPGLELGTWDLIYIAPPQYKDLWAETLRALDGRGMLSPRGILVAQIFPKEYHALELEEFALADQRTYGSTMLCLYKNKSSPQESKLERYTPLTYS
ncbi:MAG: 16S rRNA (guanine(966)-N(2))-methyltransferase RsmD [Chloroflexi bacterium]|nr:16S rRNA (guanine(966)-N(2))-methyltransferase RsmD [Chloroflexota bacterium]